MLATWRRPGGATALKPAPGAQLRRWFGSSAVGGWVSPNGERGASAREREITVQGMAQPPAPGEGYFTGAAHEGCLCCRRAASSIKRESCPHRLSQAPFARASGSTRRLARRGDGDTLWRTVGHGRVGCLANWWEADVILRPINRLEFPDTPRTFHLRIVYIYRGKPRRCSAPGLAPLRPRPV
jgi:hypothetical protein